MKASELLVEILAEEKLRKIGWKKENCYLCEGKGYIEHAVDLKSGKLVKNFDIPIRFTTCLVCHGKGGTWNKTRPNFVASYLRAVFGRKH